MRIVFIGGTRFIGRAAATEAVFRGHDVSVLHRGQHLSDVPGARDVRVDRRDPSALARAVAEARPDAVIDTLAMTKSDAESTALALKITPAPVVVLSSGDVYAEWTAVKDTGADASAEYAALDEDAPLSDVAYPYRGKGVPGAEDYDKKEVEAIFRAAADVLPRVCILRLPAVYGRRDTQRRFGAIVDVLDDGRELPCAGGAPMRWTHGHVRDVAHAIVLAAERAPGGMSIYNVGEARTPTMHDRVVALAAYMKRGVRWRETDEALPPELAVLGRMRGIVTSTARIRAALGFSEVTSEDERTRDVIAWARETRGASA